ncbi:MAG: DNA recombination protein RmuC [Pseudomonadota bacterium]
MIQIGTWHLDLSDPATQSAVAVCVGFVVVLALLIAALRAAKRGVAATVPLATGLAQMDATVARLGEGQAQLSGGLAAVSEAQIASQAKMMQLFEARLEDVTRTMGDSLATSATRTAHSLGELRQRLETIDKAQDNIQKLSGNVLGLQDILANKQTRGAFGEIQLLDIVKKALPPNAYGFQVTLSNNRRADCVIYLPNPPGDIVIDAKFPLEPYERLVRAPDQAAKVAAARDLRAAVRTHIKDIAERYILEGETADGALMFLPSEAVYAELHANFADVVREGFDRRVWIVSPTTAMATLNTLRGVLKDVRMRAQAAAIRRELSLLAADVERLETRVGNLGRHFDQASKDIDDIKLSASKAGRRARKLDQVEFDGAGEPPADPVAQIGRSVP